MNYISYKYNDGTVESGFKVKMYDIIIPNAGYWKDELCIIVHIYEEDKRIKCRVIKNGIDLNLKVNSVRFVNHNNRQAAKSYIELCNKMSKNFVEKYKNKDYIIKNWETDAFILNEITATTIANGVNINIGNINSVSYPTKALLWITKNKDIIDSIIRIGNLDYILKSMNVKNNIKYYEMDIIIKLYSYFWDINING